MFDLRHKEIQSGGGTTGCLHEKYMKKRCFESVANLKSNGRLHNVMTDLCPMNVIFDPLYPLYKDMEAREYRLICDNSGHAKTPPISFDDWLVLWHESEISNRR